MATSPVEDTPSPPVPWGPTCKGPAELLKVSQDLLAQEVDEAGDNLQEQGRGWPSDQLKGTWGHAPSMGIGCTPQDGDIWGYLGVSTLDVVQGALRQLSQLRVPDRMDRGGTGLPGEGFHLEKKTYSQDVSARRVRCPPPRPDTALTTPMRSPRPYSPISSFLPLPFWMTERRRPLSAM